jgi:formate-dependent nitrite reductase cytochrome c552 subunit
LTLSQVDSVLAGSAFLAASAAQLAVPAKTESTWDNVKDYSHKEKNKAVAAGKQLIADTDKKIDELAKQAKNSSAETKAAHEANMKELQQKKKAAQVELDKLGKATGDVWDATKTGFSDAGKALGAAYDKAAAAVKK